MFITWLTSDIKKSKLDLGSAISRKHLNNLKSPLFPIKKRFQFFK